MQSSNADMDIDPNLECSVCSDILFKPVSLNCGHTYCKACLINILATKPQCPLCRTPCFLQEQNLKENVILKNHIESKYPDHIKRRQNAFQDTKNEVEIRDERGINPESSQEEQREPFNPLVILPLSAPIDKTLFPGTEENITIRINFNPQIIQNVCNDKKFLALPDSITQEKKDHVTCILEFRDLTLVANTQDMYRAQVKVCQRVIVNHYSQIDLDQETLEKMGFPNAERSVTLQVGKGHSLKDHNVAMHQQIEEQVNYLEEFLNVRLNEWMHSSPTNAQVLLQKMQDILTQAQNRNMNYFVNFSFCLARVLRCSNEDKRRMFETTNTLERLLILKHIVEPYKDRNEIGVIFDVDLPGQSIFNNPKSAILVLVAIVIALLLFGRRYY